MSTQLITSIRIDIQDRVRRLPSEPTEENNQEVDRLRKLLTAQIDALESHPHRPTEFSNSIFPRPRHDADITIFDDLDDPNLPELQTENKDTLQQGNEENTSENDISTGNIATDIDSADRQDQLNKGADIEPVVINTNVVQPERRPLPIPSNYLSAGNIYRTVELDLRIQQAARSLHILRDLIADKSFQFSHVIRVAPRKGV